MPTLYISSRLSFAPASGVLHHSTRSKGHRIRAKRGKSEFFFGMLWCFLGIFGDRKGRNTNIFLKYGVSVCGRVLLWWWCPLVQRCAGVRCFRTCRRLALVLWWCAPRLLSAFLLCLWCIALEYGSISRFKGVLRGFYGADVCLYRFGVLRGLCGFCARVELGGYMT